MEKIRLTQTVQKGGCAAKVAAHELRHILSQVRFPKKHPELLVDGGLFDDAAIYKISDTQSMVQTLDFFTPIVDSPALFGRIAATNALSDVYAMGGRPKTCMAILAFPVAQFEHQVVIDVLQGASDAISEAQANFVGGHSIDDDTLKFGLSVTGIVDNSRIWSNNKAETGDVLVLTKALGTGTCTAALKRQEKSEEDIVEVLNSMGQLNNVIDFLPEELQTAIHAATDITGFGLSGHGMQMARASQKSFSVKASQLPFFPMAAECIERGFLTKAHRTNREYTQNQISASLPAFLDSLIHDPQTSGGLLLAVRADKAAEILKALRPQFKSATIIGSVQAQEEKALIFE